MNNTVHVESDNTPVKATRIATWLLAHGKAAVTTEELAGILGIPNDHVRQRLAPLRRQRDMVSPARGLWIPVPPEFNEWGAPPAIEIIDAMMKHLETGYYVGWLSAAAFLGAAHHAPQVFQVATSKSIRSRTVGRSRFQFLHRENLMALTTFTVETRSGSVPVSTRAVTLLDIASDIGMVGGIQGAVNLIIELCDTELCDTDEPIERELSDIAQHFPAATLRRLGWIMENFTNIRGLEPLAKMADDLTRHPSLLDPSRPYSGKTDAIWRLNINTEVKPDV